MSSVLITNLFGIGILLHTYPSRKPTLTLTSHLGAKCWLRGGVGGQFPKRIMILILIQGENLILTLLDTGFQVLDSGFFVSGTWITDCGLRIPIVRGVAWAVFRIPKATIPRFYCKSLLDSGIQIPLHGAYTLSSIKINWLTLTSCVPVSDPSGAVGWLPLTSIGCGVSSKRKKKKKKKTTHRGFVSTN